MSSQKEITHLAGGEKREYLRTHDVARKLGISQKLVIRLIRQGMLPGFQLGRVWLVSQPKLEAYLASLVKAAEDKVARLK